MGVQHPHLLSGRTRSRWYTSRDIKQPGYPHRVRKSRGTRLVLPGPFFFRKGFLRVKSLSCIHPHMSPVVRPEV